MLKIELRLTATGLYRPVSNGDLFLLQHCMNEDFVEITKLSLDKARYIAAAHGWEVVIVP